MRYLKTYKLFEASTIRADKSFESVVKDILADLIDEDIKVGVGGSSPVYGIDIRSAPRKMGFSENKLATLDISPQLLQLVSFIEGDYVLNDINIGGLENGRVPSGYYRPGERIVGSTLSKKVSRLPNENSEEFLRDIMKQYQGSYHYITNIGMLFKRSNASIFKHKLDNNEFHLLNDDSEKTVVLDKYLNDAGRAGRRVYYILFKNSEIGALKLVYDLNSNEFRPFRGSKQNFKVYDNYNAEIDFNKLEVYLMKNDMKYGTFNDAWYYIEDNFNNQGYTS